MSAQINIPVLVNGDLVDPKTAAVSVWDSTFQRGDGLFDIVWVERNAEGKLMLIGLDLHFVRIFRSAKQIMYEIDQSREVLEQWMRKMAELGGPGKIRILFTRGVLDSVIEMNELNIAPKSVIMLWHPIPQYNATEDLLPLEYPWSCYQSKTCQATKWMSYASNMLMTRMAVKEGFSDALFMTLDGYLLEGPTFSINFIKNGEIYTPSVEQMNILPSITTVIVMTLLQNVGYKIHIGKFHMDEVLAADEVFEMSATRVLVPIEKIGEKKYKVEQGLKLREIAKKGIIERENWIGHLTSPYDFPLDL